MVLQPEVILEVVPPAHSFVRLVTSQKFDSTSGGTARFGRIIKVSDESRKPSAFEMKLHKSKLERHNI